MDVNNISVFERLYQEYSSIKSIILYGFWVMGSTAHQRSRDAARRTLANAFLWLQGTTLHALGS